VCRATLRGGSHTEYRVAVCKAIANASGISCCADSVRPVRAVDLVSFCSVRRADRGRGSGAAGRSGARAGVGVLAQPGRGRAAAAAAATTAYQRGLVGPGLQHGQRSEQSI